jgi:hypothetical protein
MFIFCLPKKSERVHVLALLWLWGGAGGSGGERGGGMSNLGMLVEWGGEGWRGEQFGYAG